jgi:hypothetical protein
MRQRITKGLLFWKYEWYSICSVHYNHNEHCKMCTSGGWVHCWSHIVSSLIYKLFPKLWIWYMNLPHRKRKFFNDLNKGMK